MKNAFKSFALVFILAGFLGFLCSQRQLVPQKTLSQAQNQIRGFQSKRIIVSLKISFAAGVDKVFDQSVEERETALALLEKTVPIEKQGEGKDAFVTAISNVKADKDKREYWAFYINGKPSMVGAGSYQLKEGDEIEWKLENY